MDKEKLVRRIISGKVYTTVEYLSQVINVIFVDPQIDILCQADRVYDEAYRCYKNDDNVFTLEESYDRLIKSGRWSPELEHKLSLIDKDLKTLREKLPRLKFKKIEQKAIEQTIEDGQKERQRLLEQKHLLSSCTLEFLCDKAKRRFIISKTTIIEDEKYQGWFDYPDFCDTLVNKYNGEHPDETGFRELARSNPWRLYWSLAKDTGTPLFDRPATELTEVQFMLLSWTKMYDFAFESTHRPTDDIINDDVKFDAWYQQEQDRLDKELTESYEKEHGHQNVLSAETYYPADKEGAKEVYKLNDPQTRAKIKQREKVVKEKGNVEELNLPDVKKTLMIEQNRQIGEKGKPK